ncbi:MAG: sigma-54 dependent transcriptional regulator [Nitrospirota bacterium]
MMAAKGNILVVDDEPNARKVLSAILSDAGYRVIESMDAEKAMKRISRGDVDLVITDVKMPGMNGMQLFDNITKYHSDIPVIFLTAYGTVESAVTAMTEGASYYFIKPPDYIKLKHTIKKALDQRHSQRELMFQKKTPQGENRSVQMIGSTPQMKKIFTTIETVRDSASSVLLCGETGTGKELVARLLHCTSRRKEKPFVAVNCAAIPRDLIESELFGFEKGAFTGALSSRTGKIEEASEGTLFLDEIGDLELPLQAKLLRVLQENEIERLGSNRKIRVEFRLISSTNRDIKKMIAEGAFREDLFYRINVIQIHLPPLKERADDIPQLVTEFLGEFCSRENKSLTITDDVVKILQKYHWPGNIRQLKNTIERATILAKDRSITIKELPEDIASQKDSSGTDTKKTLKDLEMQVITRTLAECNGNKSRAAKMLGISRKTFYKRLRDNSVK